MASSGDGVHGPDDADGAQARRPVRRRREPGGRASGHTADRERQRLLEDLGRLVGDRMQRAQLEGLVDALLASIRQSEDRLETGADALQRLIGIAMARHPGALDRSTWLRLIERVAVHFNRVH